MLKQRDPLGGPAIAFTAFADQAEAFERNAGQVDRFNLDNNPMYRGSMGYHELEVAYIHADCHRTRTFFGAVLPKLDDALAGE